MSAGKKLQEGESILANEKTVLKDKFENQRGEKNKNSEAKKNAANVPD